MRHRFTSLKVNGPDSILGSEPWSIFCPVKFDEFVSDTFVHLAQTLDVLAVRH